MHMRIIVSLLLTIAASCIVSLARNKPPHKLHSLYIPSAPFPTQNSSPYDLLKYVEDVSRVIDPERMGVNIVIVKSGYGTPDEVRVSDWPYINPNIGVIVEPYVETVSIYDYLMVLGKYAGWQIDISDDEVLIIPSNESHIQQCVAPYVAQSAPSGER